MNTRQFYYLTTIAEYGNLSHAAQALDVSPSALSKFLTECERILGISIFTRSKKQLVPTAMGVQILEAAGKIIDEQNRMISTMRRASGQEQQSINLATAPNRGAVIFSKIYNQFSRRYPDIRLHLTELYASEQADAIVKGKIDLALGSGTTSSIVTDLEVAHEELLLSLPVSHPLAERESLKLSDLKDTPFVLQGTRHSIRILAEQLFQNAGFYPYVAFESNDVILLDSMMHQAVGAGLVSKVHVFPCNELVYRHLDPPVFQTLHLRYPLGHTLTEPERFLSSLLIQERLSDTRYEAIPSPELTDLLQAAESSSEYIQQNAQAAIGTSLKQIREISFDTKILEYLVAIVDEQGLSRAADRFYMAQSALSRHLKNVEDMLGITLFVRDHNRLVPSDAGKVFINNARNILKMEKDMMDLASSYRKGHRDSLFLHCDPLILPIIRENVIPEFHKTYPDTEISVTVSSKEDTETALLNTSADVGVYLTCDQKHPSLKCRTLALTELVYVFDKDSIPDFWNAGDPLPALPENRSMLLAPTGTTLRSEQERILQTFLPHPPSILGEVSSSILEKVVAAGGADIIMPLHLIDRSQHVHCAPCEPPQLFYLVLAVHPNRNLPEAASHLQVLIQHFCSHMLSFPGLS